MRRDNEKVYLILISIFLIIVFNFTWFEDERIIAGGDFFPPIDAFVYIKRVLFLWDPTISGGMPTFLDITKVVPFIAFWAFFKLIGLSILVIQRLWFISIYAVSYTHLTLPTTERV